MTKRTYIAVVLALFMGILPGAGAQTSTEKSGTPQKLAAKETAEKNAKEQNPAEKEKTENLADSEVNFPQVEPVELRPARGVRITLKAAESSKTIYEAIGQQAKLTVLFDPDYIPRNITVDLNAVPLMDALRIVAFQARSFWRPVTSDSIFIAQDTLHKRLEFEQQVLKTFYFPNISSSQDLQDIVNSMRTLVEVTRIQQVPSRQSILVRGTPEQIALVEKLVEDLNRAKDRTVGEYRLEFKITEAAEDKKASSRTYTLLIEPHQTGKLRVGSKVPIDAGENKKTYTDVGKNIDCTVMSETERAISLRLAVESSSIASDERGAPQSTLGNPVIQGTRIETNVTVELGTPTIVSSFQDPASGHHFQIEATAARTRNKE